MGIDELLVAIGNGNIAVQYLDQCATSLDWSAKRGSKITFGSDVVITPDGTEKLGIVVWLDRGDVKRIARTPPVEKSAPSEGVER